MGCTAVARQAARVISQNAANRSVTVRPRTERQRDCRQPQPSAPPSWQAPDMAFTVTYTDQKDSEHGDDDIYEVLESGVLKVTSSSDEKIHYYVMDFWTGLTADLDHEEATAEGRWPSRGVVIHRLSSRTTPRGV